MNKVNRHTESKELLWQYSHSTFRPHRHHWAQAGLPENKGWACLVSHSHFLHCLAFSLKKFNGQVVSPKRLL